MVTIADPLVLLFISHKQEKKIASYLTISESNTTVLLNGGGEPQPKNPAEVFVRKVENRGTEHMGQILSI